MITIAFKMLKTVFISLRIMEENYSSRLAVASLWFRKLMEKRREAELKEYRFIFI